MNTNKGSIVKQSGTDVDREYSVSSVIFFSMYTSNYEMGVENFMLQVTPISSSLSGKNGRAVPKLWLGPIPEPEVVNGEPLVSNDFHVMFPILKMQ